MSQADWGRLARIHDEQAKSQDRRQRQREHLHKHLYKLQLEKMIQQRKHTQQTQAERDRQSYLQQQHAAKTLECLPHQNSKFEQIVKEQANYNYTVGRQRSQRLKSEIVEEKSMLRDKYKKIETEINEEREKEFQARENNKKRLAEIYEQQISSVDSKRALERMENQRFEQLATELEKKKEQERQKHINKIRYGYYQNPESYDLIQQIYKLKEDKHQNFLQKLESSRVNEDSESRVREKKHLQTIETSNFNHNCFVQKQMRKKMNHYKDLQEENNKIITIQQQLTEQEEKQKKKKEEQRRILRTELEHQICESQENRLRWKRMSDNEAKINKECQHKAVLPGIAKDYKDYKRDLIIDGFLQNSRPHLLAGSYSLQK